MHKVSDVVRADSICVKCAVDVDLTKVGDDFYCKDHIPAPIDSDDETYDDDMLSRKPKGKKILKMKIRMDN